MNYKIVLSPDINITANDFIDLWNQSEDYQKIAIAQSIEAKASTFMDLSFVEPAVVISFIGGILSKATADFLSKVLTNFFEKLLLKEKNSNNYEIIKVEKNGECIFVVKEKGIR